MDPRDPTGGGEEGVLPFEPEEPLLLPEDEDDSSWPVEDPFEPEDEPLEPPPRPPPPLGSGTGLRGWRRASQVSLHESAHEERKGMRIRCCRMKSWGGREEEEGESYVVVQ